jgi:hypothetical protein
MTERKKVRLGTFARTVMNLQGSSGAGFRRNDADLDLDDYDSPPPALLGAMSNTNKFLREASLRAMPIESEFTSANGDASSVPYHSLQDKQPQPTEEASVRDDSSALQGRLDEISVLELMKDGYVH